MAECALAKEDFYVFVQQTYDELYRIESRVNGGKSPLAVFCRMDIGIIENPVTKEVCSICSIFLSILIRRLIARIFCKWSRAFAHHQSLDKCLWQNWGRSAIFSIYRNNFGSLLWLALGDSCMIYYEYIVHTVVDVLRHCWVWTNHIECGLCASWCLALWAHSW